MGANIFTSMPYIPYRIVMALIENDDFCKLVYYNTMDALEQPNLTDEQKRNLIWNGDVTRTDKYHIFLTNVQPNEEIENRCVIKIYNSHIDPDNLYGAVANFRFDILFGSKIPLVYADGIPCNRGDLIEREIMRSLNDEDCAGVGHLQYNGELSNLCGSATGIGNNYTYTGRTVVMATMIYDDKVSCP